MEEIVSTSGCPRTRAWALTRVGKELESGGVGGDKGRSVRVEVLAEMREAV